MIKSLRPENSEREFIHATDAWSQNHKKPKSKVQIEITKENFESFCDATGLYQPTFLEALDSFERAHLAGLVTKRKSLKSCHQDRPV